MVLRAGLVSGLGFLGDFLRGGGYLGMGMGMGGVEVLIVGSFGGGVEGREEKRLRPRSDAIMAMENEALKWFCYNYTVMDNVLSAQ